MELGFLMFCFLVEFFKYMRTLKVADIHSLAAVPLGLSLIPPANPALEQILFPGSNKSKSGDKSNGWTGQLLGSTDRLVDTKADGI